MSPVVATRSVTPDDLPAIAAMHARVFGPGRFARSAYRVREGTPDVSPFCRAATLGNTLIAAIRMTEIGFVSQIVAGGEASALPATRALLLGPLAVDDAYAGQGYGKRLVGEVIEAAREAGIGVIVLVGNTSYYARFGFAAVPAGQIRMPGPADPARILAAVLVDGSLACCSGVVRACPVAVDAARQPLKVSA